MKRFKKIHKPLLVLATIAAIAVPVSAASQIKSVGSACQFKIYNYTTNTPYGVTYSLGRTYNYNGGCSYEWVRLYYETPNYCSWTPWSEGAKPQGDYVQSYIGWPLIDSHHKAKDLPTELISPVYYLPS